MLPEEALLVRVDPHKETKLHTAASWRKEGSPSSLLTSTPLRPPCDIPFLQRLCSLKFYCERVLRRPGGKRAHWRLGKLESTSGVTVCPQRLDTGMSLPVLFLP